MRRLRLALVIAVAACGVAACGGDDNNDAVEEFLSLTQGDIPEPVAECLVERLDEEVGLERIQRLSPSDQGDFGRQMGSQLREWFAECSAEAG